MRLFVAVELPEQTRDVLWDTARGLETVWSQGRLLPRESYHITLAFLGEQPEEGLERIRSAMDGCRCHPFRASLGRLGLFAQRGGGVLWRQVRSPELIVLQQQLARGLELAGFGLERRPFQPHITLARRVALPPGTRIDMLDIPGEQLTFPVEGMALMRSQLSPQGASYQRLSLHRFC